MSAAAMRLNETQVLTKSWEPWIISDFSATQTVVRSPLGVPGANNTHISSRNWGRRDDIYAAGQTTPLTIEPWYESLREPELAICNDESDTKVEGYIEQRVALLARKYANSQFSAEESARLRILTEQVRRLVLGISEQELSIMESVSSKLKQLSAETAKIRLKYDLKI